MKNIHNLNNHTLGELAGALCVFLEEQKMATELIFLGDKHYIIKGSKEAGSFTDKMFGDAMSCEVDLAEDEFGNVVVTAGKGKWAGKVTGAVVVAAAGTLPACWPVYLGLAVGAFHVGSNAMKQVNLPEKVDKYVYDYLTL